ncbi:MAG TPA: thiamine-phosphate kinase [Gallionella sp.]|nr:thiamine-phosphate kinase [Gallionella sp.]
MSEFDLIQRFFTRTTPGALLGVGDDAALLQVSAGNVLAVSTDMLVCGTHFLPDADPFQLGHKTLAVNLSDMAAMGATPRWATLALALPFVQGKETIHERPHPNPPPVPAGGIPAASGSKAARTGEKGEGTSESLCELMFTVDETWLAQFSAGFFALADQYGVELVGGDTTRGPLNLCVTIFGEVPAQQALRRDGAQAGDEIWVSGRLGDAALALAHLQGRTTLSDAEFSACAAALYQPQPRVALGLALRGIASSAIDISDGLLADLGHILDAAQLGAEIEFEAVPVSDTLRSLSPSPSPTSGRGEHDLFQQFVLSGGDDYELCFTAPAAHHAELSDIAARLNLPLTRIGEIVAGRGCIVHDLAGNPVNSETRGYDHFR